MPTLTLTEEARYAAIASQVAPLADQLKSQLAQIKTTLESLAGFATELGIYAQAGKIDASKVTDLQAAVADAINPGKIAYAVAAVSQISGASPPICVATNTNGTLAAVTPVPF